MLRTVADMANSAIPASAHTGIRAAYALVRNFAAFSGARGVWALLYIAAGAVFESVGLFLLVPLLSLVTGGSAVPGPVRNVLARIFQILNATTVLGRLSWLMAGFVALMLVRGVVVVLRDRSVWALQIGFIESLRGEIASALADAGWDKVLRLRHARVLHVLGSDIQRISAAANYMLQSCIAIVILAAQVVLSFALSPTLALFSFALLIAGAVAMIPVLRRASDMGHFIGTANMSLLNNAGQFLGGLKLALSQDLQGSFVAEFRSTTREMTSRQLRYVSRQTMGRSALTTLSALVGAAVFLVGFGVEGLPVSVLLTFLVVIGRMSGPTTQIQQGFQQLAFGLPAYEAVAALLSELGTGKPPRGTAGRTVLEGSIVFETVSYRHPYADDREPHGVDRISLVVAPGSVLGITGTSGAGKTTLVDLLVGLLHPQAGRILIGGTVLDDKTLPDWRASLSYISQDPFLFHDTVRRNLLWARPGASEAELWDVLSLAGADAIVRGMEGGLDAVVGERGMLISGGERQRIALARALLRKPRLLIMDEATNAIDIESERILLERIVAIRPRPTIIMIAHRAETLALCDRVVHIKAGRMHDVARGAVAAIALPQ